MGDLDKANESVDSLMASMNLSPEQQKLLKSAIKSEGKSRRMGAAEIEAKYSHVVKGSMRFNPTANKQQVTIRCTTPGCTKTREVFTSDLFQVRSCEDHKKAERKAAREAQKKLLEDFKKRQQEAKAAPTPEPIAEPGEEISEDAEVEQA